MQEERRKKGSYLLQGVGPLGWRAHQDCEPPPAGPWSTHLEPEPSAIRQTWLFRVHLSTDGLQVSVKPAIIKGAEFHLYCLRAPDDQAWQAEERGQPMPGRLSIGSRKIGSARPHHQIGERQLEHGHHLIFGMLQLIHHALLLLEVF